MTHSLPTSRLSFIIVLALVASLVTIKTVSTVQAQQTPATDSAVAPQETLTQEVGETDNITLTAIPPRLGEDRELIAKPGEKIQTVLKVRNSSSQPMPISTLVSDFILDEDGSTPIPITDEVSNRWSLASWVTISPENQVIKPGQTAQVNVVISVPQDALPGGHYAMVTHEPSAMSAAAPAQSRVSQRVGTLLYFLVDGPINESAFIRNFQFRDFSEYGPVPYTFTVENLSDIHIKPAIDIKIQDMLGRTVETMVVEPKNVFPLTSRTFEGQWDRVWGFGRYTAKLTMSFGQQGQVVMSSHSFWLIPVKLVTAIGLVILTLLGIMVAVRRHIIHRRGADKQRIEMLEQRLQQMETRPPGTDTDQSTDRMNE